MAAADNAGGAGKQPGSDADAGVHDGASSQRGKQPVSKLLEISGLTKRFGPITAVDDLSMSVDRGEVVGFLGPNGSGKTTTMRMVTGYLPPTAGEIRVADHDVVRHPIEIKRRIGYLPEGAPAYGDMSPRSLFGFIADVRAIAGAAKRTAVDRSIALLELEPVAHQMIETLSKGFKRRVGLGAAILHDPELLILDEPTDGLDPNQKHQVRELLKGMSGDKAIVISTHILEEVDAVCTRAVVISRGRMLADELPQTLEARSHWHNAVAIRVQAAHLERAIAAIGAVASVASVETVAQTAELADLVVYPANGQEILSPVRDAVHDGGIGYSEIRVERGRLEEVFRQLTTGEPEGGPNA